MAKTLIDGFNEFHRRLTPSDIESEAAKSHRRSIEECLTRNFGLRRFFRIGSFGNGTSIRGYSDVDYFAELPREQLNQSSSYSLRKVCNTLDARFPYTGVKVRTPAVVVPFGVDGCETTEVVPADFIQETLYGSRIYEIPNMSDGWMRSSPQLHNSYVRNVDIKHDGKVKPLVRFVKAWKYFQNVPILSFYLELYVTQYCDSQALIVYHWDLVGVLKSLWDSQLPVIADPLGISGSISPCATAAQRTEALSKLSTATIRAAHALDMANNINIAEAFYWLGLLYNSKFPAYG